MEIALHPNMKPNCLQFNGAPSGDDAVLRKFSDLNKPRGGSERLVVTSMQFKREHSARQKRRPPSCSPA